MRAGMGEIEFCTYPAPFKWTQWYLKKIPLPVSLILFNQKILLPLIDQTGLVVNEIERDLSFNLINIIKSYLYWWNINKSHSKTKQQTHEIPLNLCKIQVLMRTNKLLWYKWDKTLEWSWMVNTTQVCWERYWWISFTIHEQ